MKKSIFALLFLMVGLFSFSQDSPSSTWAKNKVVIDGQPYEWNLPLKNYDNVTGLFFDLENDGTNLYLCFQTKNEMNEEKILRSGMKIILSSKINGKHKSIIDFPLPASKLPESKDEVKPDPLSPHENRHASMLEKDTLMEVKGFTSKDGIISSRDVSSIHAAINWDSSRVFTYELAIPLVEMFGSGYDLKDLSKGIFLDVIINPVHSDNSQNRGQGGYSGRGGGRMGGGGGRMGGGGGYGGMRQGGNRMGEEGSGQYQGGNSFMSQKTELKQKFILATE